MTTVQQGLAVPSLAPKKADALELKHLIERAAHLLPAQGPIRVFIHHNTLHAFEHLPFHEALVAGSQVFGCQPYLPEARYREELASGRIRFSELQEVLQEELGTSAGQVLLAPSTRFDVRLAMLQYAFRMAPTEELLWFVAETDALHRVRPEASAVVRARLIAETRHWVMRDLRGAADGSGLHELLERFGESTIEDWSAEHWERFTLHALWRVCRDGVATVPVLHPPAPALVRPRDLLLEVTGVDADLRVHEVLIPFCAAFLDQGVAHSTLPERERGFLAAFCTLYERGDPPTRWMAGLAAELARLREAKVGPLESIQQSLEALGVGPAQREDFLTTTLLALRGWAGMIHYTEERGDRVAHPSPPGSLVEYLAVRLLLERLALAFTARETLGYRGPLAELRQECQRHLQPPDPPSVEQRAFRVFQIAQLLGWSPARLQRLRPPEWAALLAELEAFNNVERRRIFHLAYERRFCTRALDALALRSREPQEPPATPPLQVLCCLDEREESFRRHLEELAPEAETIGAAGFYSVPMYYRGVGDAHFVPLCPIIVRPKHWVTEQADDRKEETHRRRVRTRRQFGLASHLLHVGTRRFALGALLSMALGVLASVPLIGRVLFPRVTARVRRRFGRIVHVPPRTMLELERTAPDPGPTDAHVGFTVEEMTAFAERLLRDTGLTARFGRLVLVLGHGSFSLNNPHVSAYNCGACGGAEGGPNARAIARILNDRRVRDRLAPRGLAIPDTTVFVGGMHNTCNETVELYDGERVPESHRADLEAARRLLEQACSRNAHERCRRFMSAPLNLSFEAARQHVEGRSEDLAQVRPELGHATNALCVVGRRARTRGLFLDRRAFLTSYDPTQDDADATILTRILQAVVPVCSGINLEYYFSHTDSPGWGCGSKLPHNITALLGVMDGTASDLRTGLPWQMVEIHEPVRLLFVIETTPEKMLRIMEREPAIGRLIRNGWVYLATLSPEAGQVQLFRDGEFRPHQPQAEQLPTARSSVDWYRGWRDHLEFARILG